VTTDFTARGNKTTILANNLTFVTGKIYFEEGTVVIESSNAVALDFTLNS
jgi:hypothetical protein